jgi:hypothetical protein
MAAFVSSIVTMESDAEKFAFKGPIYSALTDKVEHNCHFPTPGRNCTNVGRSVDFIVFMERCLIRVGKTL